MQEMIFGTISWDYSYLHFNLNGRTSLLHCTYWGIAGLIYTNGLKPWIEKLDLLIPRKWFKIATTFLVIYMMGNIAISWAACFRQAERVKNIPAQNTFDTFLDEHYPDEYIDRIFANKRTKVKEEKEES